MDRLEAARSLTIELACCPPFIWDDDTTVESGWSAGEEVDLELVG